MIFLRAPSYFHRAILRSGATKTASSGRHLRLTECRFSFLFTLLVQPILRNWSVLLNLTEPIPKSVRVSAGECIAAMFNIYEDLMPFYRKIAYDPILNGLLPGLYGLKSPATPTVFEALIDSVIEQQISLSVAHALQNRMIKHLGQPVSSRDSVYYCYPTPARLADTPVELFRSLGMTVRKGEYIREISRQVVDGSFDCEGLKTKSDTGQIIRELVKIRGIGQWTAELTILRGMHRLDAFPADDVGTRRIIAQYLSQRQPHDGRRSPGFC